MSARIFVHPAAMVGDRHVALTEHLTAHGLGDLLCFDHPINKGRAHRIELVKMVESDGISRTFERMNGEQFMTGGVAA